MPGATHTGDITLPAGQIEVPAGRMRALDPEAVDSLAASIEAIGVLLPVHVRLVRDGAHGEPTYTLLAGAHRVAACARLNIPVPAIVRESGSDLDDRLLEIAENLHRCPLTALERDQHIGAWIELRGEKQKREAISGQADQKISRGRPEGGISAAARELGIDRKDAERAQRVARLSPEARQVAHDVGLDNHRGALLAAAREEDAAAQTAAIRRQAQDRREREEGRQRQREAARQPAPARAQAVAEPAPEPRAEPPAQAEAEPNAALHRREAASCADMLIDYLEPQQVGSVIHWLNTVPTPYLIAALREHA